MQMCDDISKQVGNGKASLTVMRVDMVSHGDNIMDRHSIYSCDFQPGDRRRLVTGGADCYCRVWDTHLLLNLDSSGLLCSVSHHSGHIHVVRWCMNGKIFASGSVDRLIHLYALDSKSATGNLSRNRENWIRVATLQGHGADVLDLDWSAHGYIASASVDNNIVVWDCSTFTSGRFSVNTRTTIAPLRILSLHKSFVKGVSFDPIGHYLLSCSEDGSLVIIDCDSWNEIVRLDGRCQSTERSIFSRLSWAPDGSSFCVSSGRKSSKPIGSILKRDSWISAADLVGHDVECMSCRFLPYLTKDDSDKPGSDPLCVVAVGDLNGKMSVWSSSHNRPIIVLEDIFSSAVTDMSWTELGNSHILAACSLDGYLCAINFGSCIGAKLDEGNLSHHFVKLYGRDQKEAYNENHERVSDPLQLAYMPAMDIVKIPSNSEDALNHYPEAAPANILGSEQSNVLLSASQILALQQKSKTKDGKKRIRPVAVAEETIESLIEPRNDDDKRSTAGSEFSASSKKHCSLVSAPDFLSAQSLIIQTEKYDSNSIIPVSGSEPKRKFLRKVSDSHSDIFAEHYISGEILVAPDSIRLSTISNSVFTKMSKIQFRRGDVLIWETYVAGAISSLAACPNAMDGQIDPSLESALSGGLGVIGCMDGSIHLVSLLTGARLAPPLVVGAAIAFVDVCPYVQEDSSGLFMEQPVTTDGFCVLVCAAEGDLIAWHISYSLAAKINSRAGDGNFQSISINCMSEFSIRPAIMSMHCTHGLQHGNCNTVNKCTVIVDSCELSSSGRVIVSLQSKGASGGEYQSFAYSFGARSWIRIADLRHVLSRLFVPSSVLSDEMETIQSRAISNTSAGVKNALLLSKSLAVSSNYSQMNSWSSMVTLSHIEEQLSVAIALKSNASIQKWLKEYIQLCAKAGMENRIYSMVNDLVGCRNGAKDALRLIEDVILPALSTVSAMSSLFIAIHDIVIQLKKEGN